MIQICGKDWTEISKFSDKLREQRQINPYEEMVFEESITPEKVFDIITIEIFEFISKDLPDMEQEQFDVLYETIKLSWQKGIELGYVAGKLNYNLDYFLVNHTKEIIKRLYTAKYQAGLKYVI